VTVCVHGTYSILGTLCKALLSSGWAAP